MDKGIGSSSAPRGQSRLLQRKGDATLGFDIVGHAHDQIAVDACQ